MKRERKKRKFHTQKTEFRVDCRTTCDGVEISMPRLKRFINFQPTDQPASKHEYEHEHEHELDGKVKGEKNCERESREREKKRENFMLHWKSCG
jgi:hypothetical protein